MAAEVDLEQQPPPAEWLLTAGQQIASQPPRCSSRLLNLLGFAVLTFNSGMALIRSRGNPWDIAFVSSSHVALTLLFFTLRKFEGAPNSRRALGVKAAVWALTALLTVMFVYKVAAVMPPVIAFVVSVMAAAALAGIYSAYFCS